MSYGFCQLCSQVPSAEQCALINLSVTYPYGFDQQVHLGITLLLFSSCFLLSYE